MERILALALLFTASISLVKKVLETEKAVALKTPKMAPEAKTKGKLPWGEKDSKSMDIHPNAWPKTKAPM